MMSDPTPMPWLERHPEDRLAEEAFGRLFERRRIFLRGALEDRAATRLNAELLTLEAESTDIIMLYVNSQGGPLPALFSVTDTLDLMVTPVATLCFGQAMGSAAALLASGSGGRHATANARISLRQEHQELSGTARDLEQEAEELHDLQARLYALLSAATGKAPEVVQRDVERGLALSAAEAKSYGLIDDIARRP